jgi:hypothetical protein
MSPPARAGASRSRSLAEELRGWDEAALVALLRARPDLLTPPPPDLSTVAARSAGRDSLRRALDGLDLLSLQVLDALAVQADPARLTDTARLLGVRPAQLGGTLHRLRALALLWGPDSSLRLVTAVRDVVGPHVAGLGPPLTAASAHLSDGEALDALLSKAPDGSRVVLERLAAGPPVGVLGRAGSASEVPVRWLLDQGLLVAADHDHVVLPREIGLAVRGGLVHRGVTTDPPPAEVTRPGAEAAEAAAGAAAGQLLRLIDDLAQAWGANSPTVLRSGGLGVRDLRRTAATLDVDQRTAATVVELAYAAGLIADDGEADPHWAPTPAFDTWAGQEAPARWARIALAWLGSGRAPGLVGSRDDKDAVRNALSAEVSRPTAAGIRSDVLTDLARLDLGAAPRPESLLARLRWRRPRRTGGPYEDFVRWCLAEAELIGVTGRGALTAAGRLLAAGGTTEPATGRFAEPASGGTAEPGTGRSAELARVIGPTLPAPVDHVLLQADLTAVAPGPLQPEVARLMDLTADVESRGAGTVYRFSPASVRRALDAGWDAGHVVRQLAEHSRTPVPQPLEYLVRDVARRHGLVRVGSVTSYVRSDDPAVLQELLADRRATSLRLRMLAPTVLTGPADPTTVLEVLRRIGLAPAAESALGEVVVRRPDARRTPPRRPPAAADQLPVVPGDALLQAVVRSLRSRAPAAVDEPDATDGADATGGRRETGPVGGPRPAGPSVRPTEPATTLATLRAAVASRSLVWVGYVEDSGRVDRRAVRPLAVEAGRVTALDEATDRIRTLSVHRVIGVTPAGSR